VIETQPDEAGGLRPPARDTLAQRVAQQLLELIASGTYRPGDRLPTEKELVATLAVSRQTVREAMQRLAHAGVVRTATRRGTIVAPVSASTVGLHSALSVLVEPESLLDLFEVRSVIEPEMAALAAERATPEQVEQLATVLREQEGFVKREEVRAYIRSDVAFHLLIAEMVANRVLLRMLRTVHSLSYESRRTTAQVPGANQVGVRDHWAIFAAIQARDASAARQAMREHLVHTSWDLRHKLGEAAGSRAPLAMRETESTSPGPGRQDAASHGGQCRD
jgi:GntR family transcriptional repressor for pyruvate dehydrogenase complex